MAKRKDMGGGGGDLPPAVLAAREQQRKWLDEAREWVRDAVLKYIPPEGDGAKTCAEIMSQLDADPTMPHGYGHLVRSETVSYNKRYHMVRNILEDFARKRVINIGTTINARGRERSSTYALAKAKNGSGSPDVQELLKQFLAGLSEQGVDVEQIANSVIGSNRGDDGTKKQADPADRRRKPRRGDKDAR